MLSFMLTDEKSNSKKRWNTRDLYAINDGKKLFINRVCSTQDSTNTHQYDFEPLKNNIESFLVNHGKFVCLNNCPTPDEILTELLRFSEVFCRRSPFSITQSKKFGYFRVSGGINNFARRFHYVIYCETTLNEWIAKAKVLDPTQDYTIELFDHSE